MKFSQSLRRFHELLALASDVVSRRLLAQPRTLLVEVDRRQHGADRLGADVGAEGVVTVLVEGG